MLWCVFFSEVAFIGYLPVTNISPLKGWVVVARVASIFAGMNISFILPSAAPGGILWCFLRQILELQAFPLACNLQKTPKMTMGFFMPKRSSHSIQIYQSFNGVKKKSNTEVLGAGRNVASFSSWSLPKVNKRLCNMKGLAALPLGCCDSTGQVQIRFLSKGAGIMARILKATVQSSRVLASSQSPQANLWVKSWWVGELRLIKMDQRGC